MMWRQVDLVYSFLPLVSIATFWCVVYGQSNIDGPCKACPIECIPKKYVRYWWKSMWGFIITLVALIMDVWGVLKATDTTKGIIQNLFTSFFVAILHPLGILWAMLKCTVDGLAILANLREALGNDVIAPLYPWSKSQIKIISSCHVIVNLSPNVVIENCNSNAFFLKEQEGDLSEALIIGPRMANSIQFKVHLTLHGYLALLRANVLPPYDELKFVRGNSSLGMIIASAQAIGYIYGVVVRCVQGLQVSPIEAIASIMNMVILMKGVLHNFSNLGHRPLLLYLLPEEETKFIEECKNIQHLTFKPGGRFKLVVSIISGILLAMGTYFIVKFLKSLSRICVVPIILFEVSLVLGGIHGITMHLDYNFPLQLWNSCLLSTLIWLNIVGYVWALIVTFKYWKGEEFDVRSSSYLSQVLPYIG